MQRRFDFLAFAVALTVLMYASLWKTEVTAAVPIPVPIPIDFATLPATPALPTPKTLNLEDEFWDVLSQSSFHLELTVKELSGVQLVYQDIVYVRAPQILYVHDIRQNDTRYFLEHGRTQWLSATPNDLQPVGESSARQKTAKMISDYADLFIRQFPGLAGLTGKLSSAGQRMDSTDCDLYTAKDSVFSYTLCIAANGLPVVETLQSNVKGAEWKATLHYSHFGDAENLIKLPKLSPDELYAYELRLALAGLANFRYKTLETLQSGQLPAQMTTYAEGQFVHKNAAWQASIWTNTKDLTKPPDSTEIHVGWRIWVAHNNNKQKLNFAKGKLPRGFSLMQNDISQYGPFSCWYIEGGFTSPGQFLKFGADFQGKPTKVYEFKDLDFKDFAASDQFQGEYTLDVTVLADSNIPVHIELRRDRKDKKTILTTWDMLSMNDPSVEIIAPR